MTWLISAFIKNAFHRKDLSNVHADPDQMLQSRAFDQGQHFLYKIREFIPR